MISSKKIELIAILLVGLALCGIAALMFVPAEYKNTVGTFEYSESHKVTISADDYYTDYASGGISKINLNGDSITAKSNNVQISGKDITLLGGGVYVLSGSLNGGSVIVDSADGAEVRLVLNGINITSEDFSAIYVKQAEKTVISIVEGTENFLSDGSAYNAEKLEEGKPDAAIYSRDDLVINGKGRLEIKGNYADGIKSNDGLKITEGNINVTSADEGINANDYLVMLGAEVNVNSGGTAIKCDHEDIEKGFIVLEKTKLGIESEMDGINASSSVYMKNVNAEIASGDDGVHAGLDLVLEPEKLNITKSYEGLEGGYITINGGEISVISRDDGINAVGDGTTGRMGMMWSGEAKTSEADMWLTVNGGHIRIETSGDGFDSNGSVVMNGGILEIYGPENSGNGSIDVGDGGYVLIMNGGSLLAAGSSGMAEHPYENSKVNTLVFYLEESFSAQSEISLMDSKGNEIVSGRSGKKFNWVCIGNEAINEGETYTLYVDGAEVASVTAVDGSACWGNRRGFR